MCAKFFIVFYLLGVLLSFIFALIEEFRMNVIVIRKKTYLRMVLDALILSFGSWLSFFCLITLFTVDLLSEDET